MLLQMKKGKSKHVCEYENSEICMSRSLSDQGGQRFHYTSNQNSSSLKGSIIIDITISAPIGTQKLRITISGLSADIDVTRCRPFYIQIVRLIIIETVPKTY